MNLSGLRAEIWGKNGERTLNYSREEYLKDHILRRLGIEIDEQFNARNTLIRAYKDARHWQFINRAPLSPQMRVEQDEKQIKKALDKLFLPAPAEPSLSFDSLFSRVWPDQDSPLATMDRRVLLKNIILESLGVQVPNPFGKSSALGFYMALPEKEASSRFQAEYDLVKERFDSLHLFPSNTKALQQGEQMLFEFSHS